MEDWLEFMFSRADAIARRAASRLQLPRQPRHAAVRSYLEANIYAAQHGEAQRAALHTIAIAGHARAWSVCSWAP
jgi:hypothetical protein